MKIPKKVIIDFVRQALSEDIGSGDVTTEAIVPERAAAIGRIVLEEDAVIAGIPIAEEVFRQLNGNVRFTSCKDGVRVKKGTTILKIRGSARALLAGERTALNILQRLSGIATLTAHFVKEIAGTKAKIADTRKTTPCLRIFEKYAVAIGGGHNHRFGLYDAVMIKDNHIMVAGSIKKAVAMTRQNIPHTMKIEVETTNLKEVKDALTSGTDIIMLDNMSIPMMKKAVAMINKKAVVEASGNINQKNVREVALTGVDIISIGALTHSYKSISMSMEIAKLKTG
ncbi:MAG: carboxylating nicotinate-nucleotide diphosphorylase [Nitrospirota bacterium]